MFMPTGFIAVPPQKPPSAFVEWLRAEFGPSLKVVWSRTTNRFVVGSLGRVTGEFKPLVTLETPDGAFMECTDAAKMLLKSRLILAEGFSRHDVEIDRQVREAEEKRMRDRKQVIHNLHAEHARKYLGQSANAKRRGKVVWTDGRSN